MRCTSASLLASDNVLRSSPLWLEASMQMQTRLYLMQCHVLTFSSAPTLPVKVRLMVLNMPAHSETAAGTPCLGRIAARVHPTDEHAQGFGCNRQAAITVVHPFCSVVQGWGHCRSSGCAWTSDKAAPAGGAAAAMASGTPRRGRPPVNRAPRSRGCGRPTSSGAVLRHPRKQA